MRVVRQDIESSVVDTLESLQPDALLIDLIDERFRVVPQGSGWVTYSPYLAQTPLGISMASSKAVQLLDEKRYGLFDTSVSIVGERIASVAPRTAIVIHRAMYAERFADGSETHAFESEAAERAHLTNVAMGHMYDRLEAQLPGAVSIKVADELTVADAGHKWGLDHFHYIEPYYEDLMRRVASALVAE